MGKARPTYDVFLSYGQQDAKVAAEVAVILTSCDLVVFDARTIPLTKRVEEATWEAMAESQAFVVVISDTPPSASTVFELGAARGWNKPVFVVVSDPASIRLPDFLHDSPLYPISRLEEVARAIKNSAGVLTDAEKTMLIEEYHRIGEPVDQLIFHPALLSKLTKQFKRRAKRDVVPEDLLRMLLRLRKGGALRPAAKKRRAKVGK